MPRHRLAPLLTSVCGHRWVPWIAPVLAMVLCLPALGVGFRIDDWMHQAMLHGVEPSPRQGSVFLEYFTFVDGDPERHRVLTELGVLPWWSWPQLQVRFLRPLSAASHVLDHALLPGSSVFAHLHSLLWLGALVAMAGACYRRFLGASWVAGLAALLYAVDEAHGIPVGWIANRNALITGTLGLAALLLHDRARRRGGVPLLAPLVLGAALLAGEAAVATMAWLVAYGLVVDTGSWRARLGSLAPAATVLVAWRAAYRWLGYGTAGSGVYIDPATSPGDFLTQLPARVVLLLADQLWSVPSTAADFLAPSSRTLVVAVALPLVLLVVVQGARRLHASPLAWFWGLGTVLSVLPVASTTPGARLLTFVGFGGAALVALFIEQAFQGSGRPVLATTLLIVHGPLAAAQLPVQAWSIRGISATLVDPCAHTLPDDPGLPDKTVVFVNSNDLCAGDLAYQLAVRQRPRPAAVRLLSSALYDIEVRRLDAHTLQIDVPAGLQSTQADRLHRVDVAMPVGHEVAMNGMTVRVTSWNEEERVDQFHVRFDADLDDPSWIWMGTVDLRSVPHELPPEGEVLRLPAAF